jgi:hypothetical protein
MSPRLASSTWCTGALAIAGSAIADCRVWAKFSKMTMAALPESCNWCASSRGVYIGLTLTTTIPARKMPATATGYCGTLGSITATRSPARKPRLCR